MSLQRHIIVFSLAGEREIFFFFLQPALGHNSKYSLTGKNNNVWYLAWDPENIMIDSCPIT